MDPDPAIFVIDLQDANKKAIFLLFTILFEGIFSITSFFNRPSEQLFFVGQHSKLGGGYNCLNLEQTSASANSPWHWFFSTEIRRQQTLLCNGGQHYVPYRWLISCVIQHYAPVMGWGGGEEQVHTVDYDPGDNH
jgi:hypothetical protein